MKKKSVLALFLILALALSVLAGCSAKPVGESSAAQPAAEKLRTTTGNKETNSLTFLIAEQANSLDPQLFTSSAENRIVDQVYEPLFILDNNDNTVNLLA